VNDLGEEEHEKHLIGCMSIENSFQMKSMQVICKMKSMMKKEIEDDDDEEM
jgi:hypothetical protein